MSYIDPYIKHMLSDGAWLVPMLVRVYHLEDIPAILKAPECMPGTVIGDIFTCRGTQKTVDAFADDLRIFSVEASRQHGLE